MIRRSLWVPTWRGWLILLLVASIGGYGVLRNLHAFLAVNHPLASEVLVIEGWIPDYALKEGLDLAKERGVTCLLLTGGLAEGDPDPDPDDTYARLAMSRLRRFGAEPAMVHAVPSLEPKRDRTYASGLAIRNWLRAHGMRATSINVVTMGPHARRSRLLFGKVFGKETDVGIIPIRDREYEPDVWWRSSEGVKEVISESAAYLYARFIFSAG